jgi:hypothetical protein
MEVTPTADGGTSVRLDADETLDLIAFLEQFYANDGSTPDALCEALSENTRGTRGEEA